MNELALYIDEQREEASESVEMQLYAQLQGLKTPQSTIDKPTDSSLDEQVHKAVAKNETTTGNKRRTVRRYEQNDWRVTDFLLLLIAALLFLNIVIK